MSVVTVAEVKAMLRVTQSSDDPLLEMLIDGAEDEMKQYLGRGELPRRDDTGGTCCESDSDLNPASDASDIAPTVRDGIFLLVQAKYEGATAAEMEATRAVAFGMARSYRCMGV